MLIVLKRKFTFIEYFIQTETITIPLTKILCLLIIIIIIIIILKMCILIV
jgi:hypothetical protein